MGLRHLCGYNWEPEDPSSNHDPVTNMLSTIKKKIPQPAVSQSLLSEIVGTLSQD